VEIAGEVLVLGSTNRDLTLLTRIEDEQRIARLRTTTHPMLNTLESWLVAWKARNPISRAKRLPSQNVEDRVEPR